MANRRSKKQGIPPGQPTRQEFIAYARSMKIDPVRAGDQWDIWDAGSWCDGKMIPILNWKLKLLTFQRNGYGAFGERSAGLRPRPILQDDEWIARAHAEVEAEEERRNEQRRKER
jgi:hypothetical protein